MKLFESYQKEIKESFLATQKKIQNKLKKQKAIPFNYYLINQIKKEILHLLKIKEINLELSPSHIKADLSFACFKKNQNHSQIAQQYASLLNQASLKFIQEAQNLGPFVNLKLKAQVVYPRILQEILELKDDYGRSDVNAHKVALLDYSHPNIAKPMGVGHLRSTIIGQALNNLYQATGYLTIAENYLGDWGTQFGELIWAYQKWADSQKVAQNPLRELKNLYVRFHQEATRNPLYQKEAREIFQKLERKDDQLLGLWKKFRDLSVREFKRIYRLLQVSFDLYTGEGFAASYTNQVIEECLKKKIAQAKKDSFLVVVKLRGLPSFLLRKEDGSTLYLTRDLAALRLRRQIFNPEVILYVVGEEQTLHFQQLFALAQKLGYLKKKDQAKHISFGLMLLEGKKMATRRGRLIEAEDLIKEVIKQAQSLVKKKNPHLSQKEVEKNAQIIGLGAIFYNDLRQSRQKNISFDWERMLDFKAASAAYLQYTWVRINSILRKVQKKPALKDFVFEEEKEFYLAQKLMFYPQIVLQAQKADSPHLLCLYLEELAKAFSQFYEAISVLRTKEERLFASRLALIKATGQVIKNGLALLNIKVPEKM